MNPILIMALGIVIAVPSTMIAANMMETERSGFVITLIAVIVQFVMSAVVHATLGQGFVAMATSTILGSGIYAYIIGTSIFNGLIISIIATLISLILTLSIGATLLVHFGAAA